MKRFNRFNLVLLFIILLARVSSGPVLADHALHDHLNNGAFISQWTPLVPEGSSDNNIDLVAHEKIRIHIDSGSGLRIETSNGTIDKLIISQILESVPLAEPSALMVCDQDHLHRISPEVVIIPVLSYQDMDFEIEAIEQVSVVLERYQSVQAPYYWEKLLDISQELIKSRLFIKTIHPEMERVIELDDWSMSGMWIRALIPVIQTMNTMDHPDEYLADQVCHITTMFASLAGEDVLTNDLSSWIDPINPVTNTPLVLPGPSWIRCSMTAELDDRSDKIINEIPLNIRVNGERSGHWPHGYCRFLRVNSQSINSSDLMVNTNIPDNLDLSISKPVFFRVYLPNTTNELLFKSPGNLFLTGSLTRPIYPCSDFDPQYNAPIDLLNLIPVKNRNDTVWLKTKWLLHGENPVIQALLTHHANRIVWSTQQGTYPLDWKFDPSNTGNLYGLSDNQEYIVHVDSEMHDPNALRPLHIYDPDRQVNDPPVEVIIDGKKHIHAVVENPYATQRKVTLAVLPGPHSLRINGFNRAVYVDEQIELLEPEPIIIRRYSPVQIDDKPVIFQLDGGTNGIPMRLYFRHLISPVHLYLDGLPWKTITPLSDFASDQELDIPRISSVEFTIPSGTHSCWFKELSGELLVSVMTPLLDDVVRSQSLVRDPLLSQVYQWLDTPPEQPELMAMIARKSVTAPERSLLIALAGDPIRARDQFLTTGYDENLVSHRMILSWLQAETGNNVSALDIAWPIITDPTLPYCNTFHRQLLESALDLGGLYQAGLLAQTMFQHHSEDTIVNETLAFLQKPESVNPGIEWLINSSSQRFVKIPLEHISTNGSRLTPSDNDCTSIVLSDSNPGSTLTIDVVQPTMLKLKLQAPRADNAVETRLALGSDSIDTEVIIPFKDEEQTRSLIMPVLHPGKVTVECLAGCVSVESAIQVFSLKDCLDQKAVSIEQKPDPLLVTQICQLLNQLSDPENTVTGVALTQQLQKRWPQARSIELIHKLLTDTLIWKRLGGWPERSHGRRYVSSTDTPHDPLIELRGIDVPDIEMTTDSWIMTHNQSLQFDASLLGHGRVQLDVSALPATDYKLTVELDRRIIEMLTAPESQLTIPWHPGRGNRIRIRAESVTGRFPIKMGLTHISSTQSDQIRAVPLWGNRRFNRLQPGNQSNITGRIIGPACLKLTLRSETPGSDATEVRIHAYTVHGDIAWEEIISLPQSIDPYCLTVPDGVGVCDSTEVIIPLPDPEIYQLSVTHLSGTAPVLVRAYALQDRRVIDLTDRDFGECAGEKFEAEAVEVESGEAAIFQQSFATEHSETIGNNRSGLVWNPGMNASFIRETSAAGTWSVSLGFRDREAESSDSTGDSAVDSDATDGTGGSLAWNTLLCLDNGHRFYFETDLGATQPLDDPDDLLGQLKHTTTWHMGQSGYRGSFQLLTVHQRLTDESQWRHRVQMDLRRTFRLSPRWSWLLAVGGFYSHQTLEPDDLDDFVDAPGPDIYTGFNHRHDTGGMIMTQISIRPISRLMIYVRGRTITAGDGESGLFGPWWVRGGIRGMFGPVIAGVYYEERESFGASMEPDRSRIGAQLTLHHWVNSTMLLELMIRDRYTLDEDWNDIEATLSLRFSSSNLLRNFDPNRKLYQKRIESLSL